MPEPASCPLHDPVRSQAVSSLAQVYLGLPKSPLPEPVSFSAKRSFEIGRYESCRRRLPSWPMQMGCDFRAQCLGRGWVASLPAPRGLGLSQSRVPSRWRSLLLAGRHQQTQVAAGRGVQMLETGHQAGSSQSDPSSAFQRSPPLLIATGIHACVCPAAPGPVPALCQGLVQVLGYSSEPNEARLVELYWGQLDSR